jgi:hypothetical protein
MLKNSSDRRMPRKTATVALNKNHIILKWVFTNLPKALNAFIISNSSFLKNLTSMSTNLLKRSRSSSNKNTNGYIKSVKGTKTSNICQN